MESSKLFSNINISSSSVNCNVFELKNSSIFASLFISKSNIIQLNKLLKGISFHLINKSSLLDIICNNNFLCSSQFTFSISNFAFEFLNFERKFCDNHFSNIS